MARKPLARRARALPLLALLAVVLVLAGCGGGANAAKKGTGFAVELPTGWSQRSGKALEESAIRFAGVFVDGRTAGFRTNVNVIRETAPAGTTLAAVVTTFQRQVRGGFGARIGQTANRKLGGDRATGYDYTVSRPGRTLRGRQVVAIHGGHVYTVTLTSAASAFAKANESFDRILGSWKWS